jgi:DNA repair protein RadC
MNKLCKRVNYKMSLIKKYLDVGIDGLLEQEVLELMLLVCAPKRNVRIMAKELLSMYADLNGVQDAPLEELLKFPCMGVSSVINIKLIRDFSGLQR